ARSSTRRKGGGPSDGIRQRGVYRTTPCHARTKRRLGSFGRSQSEAGRLGATDPARIPVVGTSWNEYAERAGNRHRAAWLRSGVGRSISCPSGGPRRGSPILEIPGD